MLFGYVTWLLSASILVFIVIFGFINRIFIRPYRMKKFANLLGLSYKISDKRFALFEFKKNIISGKYKGKYIEIYDYYLNAGSMSQKRTVIEISGEAINIYRGITFEYVPIISVRTIKKILDEYFNDGGVKTRGKIKKEIYVALLVLVAVFFVFMWYYLTSLTV